jgi:hypothetical protein
MRNMLSGAEVCCPQSAIDAAAWLTLVIILLLKVKRKGGRDHFIVKKGREQLPPC